MSRSGATAAGVLLVAGRGSRLGELTATRPKCLLDVSGRTILDRALDALAAAGIARAVAVAGYRTEAVRQALTARRRPPPTTIVVNERWGTTGTSASLSLALAHAGAAERLLVIEGDVVFEPRLLCALLEAPGAATLASSWAPNLDGSVLTVEKDLHVTEWTHPVDRPARFQPEGKYKSVNATAITGAFARHALAPALRSVLADDPAAPLERSFSVALGVFGGRLDAILVPPASWCEVDDANDLATAVARFGVDG